MRRNTDAENAFGDVMPTATVHIQPARDKDIPLKIQNFDYLSGQNAVSSRVVGTTGTSGSTAITACYISCPTSATVAIFALVSAFCTAGNASTSGGAYTVQAMATSGGGYVTVTTTPTTAVTMSQKDWLPTIATGVNMVALTVLGSGKQEIKWAYDVTSVILEY